MVKDLKHFHDFVSNNLFSTTRDELKFNYLLNNFRKYVIVSYQILIYQLYSYIIHMHAES